MNAWVDFLTCLIVLTSLILMVVTNSPTMEKAVSANDLRTSTVTPSLTNTPSPTYIFAFTIPVTFPYNYGNPNSLR